MGILDQINNVIIEKENDIVYPYLQKYESYSETDLLNELNNQKERRRRDIEYEDKRGYRRTYVPAVVAAVSYWLVANYYYDPVDLTNELQCDKMEMSWSNTNISGPIYAKDKAIENAYDKFQEWKGNILTFITSEEKTNPFENTALLIILICDNNMDEKEATKLMKENQRNYYASGKVFKYANIITHFENLEKQEKKSEDDKTGCFITSAVCKSFGLPDDCDELQLFRKYRDNWMKNQIDGETLIKEYYNIAPAIVKEIDKRMDSQDIYLAIWKKYLSKCFIYIKREEYGLCKTVYIQMVNELKTSYLLPSL